MWDIRFQWEIFCNMDQSSSDYNWNICFLCQEDMKEICRLTEEGCQFLSVMLPQFHELKALDIDLNELKGLIKCKFCQVS